MPKGSGYCSRCAASDARGSEFGSSDHGRRQVVLEPVGAASKRLAGRLQARVSALLGRLTSVTSHVGATWDTLSVVDTARVRVTFGPLPSLSDDPEAFAVEVHRRIQTAHGTAQVAQVAAQDEAVSRATEVAALQQTLDETASRYRSVPHRPALSTRIFTSRSPQTGSGTSASSSPGPSVVFTRARTPPSCTAR